MAAWRMTRPSFGAIGPLLALLGACLFFATQSDRFFTGDNFALVLQQVMVVGVIAIGQTLVVLTAGVDLSCGMVMALGGIVMTTLASASGVPVPHSVEPPNIQICRAPGFAFCTVSRTPRASMLMV